MVIAASGDGAKTLREKARTVLLVLADCDGVLTDASVYYSAQGEELKRFSLRDGLGVERLRKNAGVEVGIITGEFSKPLEKRAQKLGITELYQGIADKASVVGEILARRGLSPGQVAYMGDDVNDLAAMRLVGLSACPKDAEPAVLEIVDYISERTGGNGAFRELAELIISAQTS